MTWVGLIWAEAAGGVIGAEGGMPWHVPEDLAHFKEVTLGAPVVMGRKTWDSLPERFRPLPGRTNVVVTRQSGWRAEGAQVVHSLAEAFAAARAAESAVWVIGGGEIYRQSLPDADRLEITEVDLELPGDTHAPTPPSEAADWVRTSEPPTGWATSSTGIRYRFVSLHRRRGDDQS